MNIRNRFRAKEEAVLNPEAARMFARTYRHLALGLAASVLILTAALLVLLVRTTEDALYRRIDNLLRSRAMALAAGHGGEFERRPAFAPEAGRLFLVYFGDPPQIPLAVRPYDPLSDAARTALLRLAGEKKVDLGGSSPATAPARVELDGEAFRYVLVRLPEGTFAAPGARNGQIYPRGTGPPSPSPPADARYALLLYPLAREEEFLANLRRQAFLAGGLFAAVSALLGLVFADRALRPVREAWAAQRRFVADASHELRTPLQVLRLNLERLGRHGERTVAEERRTLEVLLGELARLEHLVGDLLTLAKADAATLAVEKRPVDFADIVRRESEAFRPAFEEKGLFLEVRTEPAPVWGDPERLAQIVAVLLDNAVSYTDRGGAAVVLTSDKTRRQAILKVEDSGIGIGPEERERAFDRFYRGREARRRKREGSGLGLAVARIIVQAHGGTLHLFPRAEGGTRAEVRLPLESHS
ncbi:MAG: two-component system sensor kinase [Brockia lithotrophica]|uniref:histidine kinase n=1 Tax=Brockia lithotrophica TaxID=933949 RepID=A0A2T5G5M3_9BACL|nr:HAMP domain-containing histidine kinase [Brockia lithotrophica]PTQ51491.1 MAG: two-component system sensor kinase [Brockia lithotrophica]